MKEAIILAGPTTKIVNSPLPTFNDDQVLIKVVVAGANPNDWKVPEMASRNEKPFFEHFREVQKGINQGDDIAGIVEKVGKDVGEFKVGDRVAAFHEMLAPGGSYAEYAVAWSHTTFHIPPSISFEEAATIPLTGLTAVIALYHHLSLPCPWQPAKEPTPLVIYGASTAVGSFAIRLARRSNIHPIIAIAGQGGPYVQTLLNESKGDRVVDYRTGVNETIRGIERALGGTFAVHHALDTIASPQSTEVVKAVIVPGGKVNFVLPDAPDVRPGIASNTWVSAAHEMGGLHDCRDLCYVFCRWFTRALQLKRFRGHPFQVRPGGLAGVQEALRDLKEGKASAVKYVFRIGETL